MHTYAQAAGCVLFTWELCKKAKGRRWFYVWLENLSAELPQMGWHKLGGSVYPGEKNIHTHSEIC